MKDWKASSNSPQRKGGKLVIYVLTFLKNNVKSQALNYNYT
jgi:hypothetical protein